MTNQRSLFSRVRLTGSLRISSIGVPSGFGFRISDFAAALLLVSSCPPARAAASPTPASTNILFAIADDWGYGHAGAYGCRSVKTPAFDRVAGQGILFSHAYTPNAKCAPSRACILTGRNSWQLKAAANHVPYYPTEFKTFCEALDEQGWFVGHRAEELRQQAHELELYLRRRTTELGIELRPLKAVFPLVGRKAVVYFSAEQRVDFRPLLTELGRRFRRRVEMRPLGVRDGARMTGGLGPCGRTLCCATFMERFHSVSVRLAKRQNLSLNPAKISGMCSRLMCCLAYEVDQYPAPERQRRDGG